MNASPQGPNWFSRNWKWFVPVGCLSLLVVFVAAVGLLTAGLFGIIKHAEPYRHALATAQSNPQVIAALGQPIEPGFMVQGNVTTSNDSGAADMNFPIAGPRGEATIYVVAKKTRGEWHYEELKAVVDHKRRIDLQAAAATPAP